MTQFINIYAGALVALSSLRSQTGPSDKIQQQTDTGPRPVGSADAATAAAWRAELAHALKS